MSPWKLRQASLQSCVRLQCRYLRTGACVSQHRHHSKSRIAAASIALVVGFGAYLAWPSSSRRASTSSSFPLSPYHFTLATVESSEANPLDPSAKLITVRIPRDLLPESSFLQPVYSIYVKDDDIQVERPYTPLFGIEQDGDGTGQATFWVKRYPQGEVGRWLHSKRVGDVLEIRGPVPTWDYAKEMESGKWDEIIMISGGTGITPFFQLLQKLFGRSTEPSAQFPGAHFTLMHGSPSLFTRPPPCIMSYLDGIAERHRESFTVKLFVERVDDEKSGMQGRWKEFTFGRITKKHIEDVLIERGILPPAVEASWWNPLSLLEWHVRSHYQSPHAKKVLFLVCGPESMIECIAGPRPKTRADLGRAGVLGELGYGAVNVRKL